jgi:hypothetical protein
VCSNCSGDDPRPESFASFVISSPKSGAIFAAASPRERRKYRTPRFFPGIINTLSTLGIVSSRWISSSSRIIESVDRESFVNLNLTATRIETGLKTANAPVLGHPIEIRVSPAAIIEVYAANDITGAPGDENELRTERSASAWQESCDARSNTKRTMEAHRFAHRLKLLFGYVAFVAAAAFMAWYAAK